MPSPATLEQRLTLALLYERYRAVCARLDRLDAAELEGPLTQRLATMRARLREELWQLTDQLISDDPKGGE